MKASKVALQGDTPDTSGDSWVLEMLRCLGALSLPVPRRQRNMWANPICCVLTGPNSHAAGSDARALTLALGRSR